MTNLIEAFHAAYYSPKNRKQIDRLAIPRLESAMELWGEDVAEENFRSVLVGISSECGERWQKWQVEKIVEKSECASLYALRHEFSFQERKYVRWALFASLDVSSELILPHEGVFNEGVDNAAIRAREVEADLTPIFVGLDAKQAGERLSENLASMVQNKSELLNYRDAPESAHSLWIIDDAQEIKVLQEIVEGQNIFVLDGHHRLSAAQQNFHEYQCDGRILACICSMSEEELVLLPIHRAVLNPAWLVPELGASDLEGANCKIIGRHAWSANEPDKILQTMDSTENSFLFLPAQSAHAYQMQLEVEEGSYLVEAIEKMFANNFTSADLVPVSKTYLLLAQLASGQAQAAIFLPALSAKDVERVASNRSKLPRKSTRFFPKPALGLVTRLWNE